MSEMRLLAWIHRHERGLIVTWLVGATLLVGSLAWVVLFGAADRAVDAWNLRWPKSVTACAELVEDGRFEEAVARLERLDVTFPGKSIRHRFDMPRERQLSLLGESHLQLDHKRRALDALERLVDFDARNWRNHHQLAAAQLRFGDLDAARLAFEEVVAIHATHLPSVTSLARLHFEGGHFDRVVDIYETYLDAFLLCQLLVRVGSQQIVLHVPADGRPHVVSTPLAIPPVWSGTLDLETRGYSVRLGRVELIGGLRVGRTEARDRLVLSGVDGGWTTTNASLVEAGVYTADAQTSALHMSVDEGTRGSAGYGRVELEVTVFKALDEELWSMVEISYRNVLDPVGLAAARPMSVVGGCLLGGSTWKLP